MRDNTGLCASGALISPGLVEGNLVGDADMKKQNAQI
jgi:hypothetical protein